MERLTADVIRTFFDARMQLGGYDPQQHWQESHTAEATTWLEDLDQKALYVWMFQEGVMRFATMSGNGESEGRPQDRLPAPIRQGVVREFMYFYKRDCSTPCTATNLHSIVMFGCSRGELLEGLLGLMNNIYVPVSLAHQGWPENVKKDFTSQVQKFMSTVTEMAAQGKGKTELYIPQDNFTNLDAASKDKDVVQRLEMALIYWTRQIKEVTTQQDSATEGEQSGPLDEIDYWYGRDLNLSRLHDQLQSERLQQILTILNLSGSAYLKEFRALEERIKNGSMEAKENLKFLSFLKEPCQRLAEATPPEIPAILPMLLNFVRMIWTVSPYYNKEDRISSLLRKMSNEIIKRCQATIDLKDIFEGKVEASMMQLQQSIDCGREWKEAYQKMVRLIGKYDDRQCNFSDSTIFVQIDAFVQRCCDLLEVCEGLQQFACHSRGQPMPIFGGTRAPEVKKSLLEIEDIFLRNLQRLQSVDYDLLNVTASGWQDDITTFRNQMRDLEVMYVNVINSAFDGVGTVQAAVEVLDAFYLLAKREKIKGYILKKGEYVYQLFLFEMQSIKNQFDHLRRNPLLPIIQGHPNFAGTALWVKGLLLRIQRQMDELHMLCYLEDSREQQNAREMYANLHRVLEDFVQQTFNDWVHELKMMGEANLGKRLQIGLLNRPEEALLQRKGGQLESNFDKELLKMFQEVYYWEKIQGSGIVVPYAAHEIASQRDQLRVLREHVLRVVRDYNQIIQALKPLKEEPEDRKGFQERKLFLHHIRNLDRKIGPGLSKYTWNSQGIKEFFVRDSCRECAKVFDYVKQFKKNDAEINAICKQIANLRLIEIQKKAVHSDSQFRLIQERCRERVQRVFRSSHEKITDLMLHSYGFFEHHPNDIQREWRAYVEKIDKTIESDLKKCVKTSLQELCRALNGDSKTEPSPLFRIQAVLDDIKMDFKPPMNQLKDLLQLVCRDMTMTLMVIPRLGEHLLLKKLERDKIEKQKAEEAGDMDTAKAIDARLPTEEDLKKKKKKSFFEEISKDDDCCIRFVKEVLRGFNNCAVKLGERMKWWNSSYQPIVSQDKDTFIRRYKKTERSLTIVGQDIQRYKEVQSDIQSEDPKVVIDFIETDFSPLKNALTYHCQQWQAKLTDLLNENARTEMNKVLEYFDNNSKTLLNLPMKDMDELKFRLQLLEQCKKDDEDMEGKISPIEAKYSKLAEFEVVPPDEELLRKAQMRPQMERFREVLAQAEMINNKEKKKMKAALEQDLAAFAQSIRDVKSNFQMQAPYKSDTTTNETAFSILQNFRNQLGQKRAMEEEFAPKLELFGIEPTTYKELTWVDQEMEKLGNVWELRSSWDDEWNKLKVSVFRNLDTEAMDELAMQFQKSMKQLQGKDKTVQNWPVFQQLKARIELFRTMIPLIANLRQESMRDRHFNLIINEVNEHFDPRSDQFTLQRVFDLRLDQHAELIARLADDAKKEAKIENGLESIRQVWAVMKVDVVDYKSVYFKLRSTEDLYTALEEHILQLGSFKSSQFYLPFAAKVEHWERSLANISEVCEAITSVQRSWMYLENIFVGSEDIRPHLPDESILFDDVNAGFTDMLRKVHQDPLATKACAQPRMLETLNQFQANLETIQKSLNDYLEKKRNAFPRFYFLSNEDLLEILGQARDPEQVQKHIKKCFEGVKSMELSAPSAAKQQRNWEAVGLVDAPKLAADVERVKLVKTVVLEGPVEVWLGVVEKRMIESLRKDLCKCHTANSNPKSMKKEKWVKEFPGQLLITSGQILWTTDCTTALHKMEKGQRNSLKVLKRTQTKYIAKLSDMIRKPTSKIERSKLVALITIEVHARDVQDKMILLKTESPSNFNWTSQLRFELREPTDEISAGQPAACWVLQTNTCSPYGYEYQGNNGRLVVTPMTDRCYMTLTTAMALKRGGAPQGPAGTGKTESVKDLGKGMAMFVIVFNCSDGLDYKSLGRMFSGLAQSGCWGCFDEFNRIDITVLSVVAVQIMTIQHALREEEEKFIFEDRLISLQKSCAIFVTMNPTYAGRTALPDNLKALFRPVAMMVPDLSMIMEIMLVSEGYKEFKVLAKKMYTLYMMMQQQMSKQDHYDFTLRNIKSVLSCAGSLKRREPEAPEQQLLMRAINDMNLPKWVSQDMPLYLGLLGDIFQNVEVPPADYGKLEETIQQVLTEMGCQRVSHSIQKCISIYETKITRHGNMLVGQTMGGKSVCWKTLAKAKTHLKTINQEGMEKVVHHTINPKAIDMNELYGAYDLSTMEWTDGILSSIMRLICQDEKSDEKWLVLDGPVDTLWIESMNTVLDDNKVLTLINSDRIALPPQVRLLFEVADLSVASPATVSRAGMVYFDPADLGWQPFFHSWVEKFIAPARQQDMKALGEKWIPRCLKIRKQCTELAPIVDTNAVQSLTRLYECWAPRVDLDAQGEKGNEIMEKIFVFVLVWSLGSSVTGDTRPIFDQAVREIENIFPTAQTVYEYGYNFDKLEFSLWEDRLPNAYRPPEGQAFHKIIVLTVDVVRNMFILEGLNAKHFHTLLVGTTGTGKTVAVQQAISTLEEATWTSLTINMSAMTSSAKTQEIIDGKIEKRIKNKFGPPGNKRMLTFVDDLNMPRKDLFGSQPPLELLRQWVDYECWYDRKKQILHHVLDIHLVAAMGQPGGGREVISQRLQSAFNNICFVTPAESQVKRIFQNLASFKLTDFRTEEIKNLAEPLTTASIAVYDAIHEAFLPTPEKSHYLFNLRDVSKIFQGIYLAQPRCYEEKEQMLRLWYHECSRVFSDRLINMDDRDKLRSMIDGCMDSHLQVRLKEIAGEDHDMVFAGIDLSNPEAEDPPYEQMVDRKGLKAFMELKVEDYNGFFKKAPMPLVMFKDAIEQCCKILRIIRLPRGNALLVGVGGSGRHCLTRLASYISGWDLFQVEITKQYKHAMFQEDLKKLFEKAGTKGHPMTFLFSDTEIVEENFLEDVANLLNSGEVPNIYNNDEVSMIRGAVEKQAKEEARQQQLSPEAIYNFFLSRVRENLHVVFCLSYIGSSFRDYCRMYPALVSCTTIIWFLPWPPEALNEVAQKFLREGSFAEEHRESVAEVFGRAHTAVARYSAKMLLEQQRINYVTPTNYLELVQGYMTLLREKQHEIGQSADKLRSGLSKLDDARTQVAEMSEDLEVKQEVCVKKSKECEELLHVIVQERGKADAQQNALEQDSVRIEKETRETKILAEDATRDLEKAMPALDAALDALDKLDKKSIAEVKAYTKPPDMVMKTMSAVMTVMEKTPTWAQARTELNDVNFLPRIKNFDKNAISNATLRKMEKYTKDPQFTPKTVSNVSLAAGALCQWVHAMKIYAEVYREVEPKRLKLKNAQDSLERKNKERQQAEADLKKIQEQVQNLKDQHDASSREKDDLAATAEELKVKLERAEKLVTGLAGEKGRWEVSLSNFDTQQENLLGDCIVSAAFMSYAGPFGSSYREKLVNDEWLMPVKELKLFVTQDFNFANFLALPTEVREWNLQGLPTDNFSTENGVLSTRGRRFPLLIDPQNQGNKWVRRMEGGKERQLKVLDPGSKDIMRVLERAIEWGKCVLLENVQEDLDPALEPVLSKNIIQRSPGSYSIKVGESELDYNPNFRFYITTKLANPHYTPEVSTKTVIVNFIVVEQGLTDQLLGVVVMKEEPRLEEQKNDLVIQVAKGKNRLVELENEILRLLAETKGSLLDDLSLIDTLQESKVISETVTEQVNVAEQTMLKIDAARENYRPAGYRSAVLYFVLNDLVTIDPMYQFALDAYTELYIQSIIRSGDKKIAVGSIEERIDDLNQYHVLAVYRYACRALFEKHKLLFSLHLCAKVLGSQGQLDPAEYRFFLFGGVVIDRSTQSQNPSPDWISQTVWDNITELDANLEVFKGFQTSFEQTLRDWKKWYSCPEPEKEPLPGDWDGRLDLLQKLIIIRCIRTDRTSIAVTTFIATKLDPKFVEPPPLDLEQVYDESSAKTPLLFVLTPGMDPTAQLKSLAINMKMNWQPISLGQGQEEKAQKLLEDASKQGFWGLLANCHLCIPWLPELEKLIYKTIEEGPHKNFRIFLSSSPTPKFPIQLLQGSIKMTTEPPKGLKANIVRLLMNVTSDEGFNKESPKFKKLFFSLCWFHAVLLERRKFKMLGWNVEYDFNDSDFDICENILQIYLDDPASQHEIPWDAIRYLIAQANYGGRVTELPDNRVLNAYAAEFFRDKALEPKFQLSTLPTYYIPEDTSLFSFKAYARDLPMQELPEAFGQHVNAEISSAIQDTEMMVTTIISMQYGSGGGSSSAGSRDETVMATCNALLEKLPEPIDQDEVRERNESDTSPLKVCLLQEIERYNKLLHTTSNSIKQLQRGIQGLSVISKEQEEVMGALFEGRVPQLWLFAYPSLKPMSSWTPDLIERITQLNNWGFDGIPKVFWLGGLTYPTSFLTALLQASARKNAVSVDLLSFDFLVQSGEESSITALPKEGAYFKGMILEGAKWDMNTMALADAETMQLLAPMPVIHFKPITKKKVTSEGFYTCPLYLYPVRTGSRERPSFMTWIDLKSGQHDGNFWIKRGTALLLSQAT